MLRSHGITSLGDIYILFMLGFKIDPFYAYLFFHNEKSWHLLHLYLMLSVAFKLMFATLFIWMKWIMKHNRFLFLVCFIFVRVCVAGCGCVCAFTCIQNCHWSGIGKRQTQSKAAPKVNLRRLNIRVSVIYIGTSFDSWSIADHWKVSQAVRFRDLARTRHACHFDR